MENMSRVERKKNEKIKDKKKPGRYLMMILLFFLLLSGIVIVDDSFRGMMMIDEPRVFEYRKINETMVQIYLCGEKLYVDEEKIKDAYGYVKDETKGLFKTFIEKSNQWVNRINAN